MKAAVGTALSLTGVLVAGSAAALVNTQVLQGADSDSSASALELTSTSVTTAVGSTSDQVVLRVGEAAVITLHQDAGSLSIVSVVPSPGWEVGFSAAGGFGEVEVHLLSGAVEVSVRAWVDDDGEVETDVAARGIPEPGVVHEDDDRDDDDEGPPPAGTMAPSPPAVPGATAPTPAQPAPAVPGTAAASTSPSVTHEDDEHEREDREDVEDHDEDHEDDDDD